MDVDSSNGVAGSSVPPQPAAQGDLDASGGGAQSRSPTAFLLWHLGIDLGVACGLVLVAETIHRGAWSATHAWVIATPAVALANVLLVFCLAGCAAAVLNRRLLTRCLLTLVLLGLARASAAKLSALGEPLLPWDVRYAGQMLTLAMSSVGIAQVLLLIPLLAMPVAALWLDKRYRFRLPWRHRAVLGLATAILPTILALHWHLGLTQLLDPFTRFSRPQEMGAPRTDLPQRFRFRSTGFALCSIMLAGAGPAAPRCDGYDSAAVQEVLDQLRRTSRPRQPIEVAARAPHIIVVLNEALWDVTLLPKVRFERDPLAHLRAAMQEATPRECVSPALGGITCNPEFELLTGWSMKLLPPSSVPYTQYIRSPTPSLPRFLKQQGYRCIAMHCYDRQFWCRDSVYRCMGFDRFDAIDTFGKTQLIGNYPTDEPVVSRMISEIEAAQQPTFLFAVTIQNHTPYRPGLYAQRAIRFTHSLPEESAGVLDTYVQGLYHADQLMGRLVRFVRATDKPVILVVVGDHLPALSASLANAGGIVRIPAMAGLIEGTEPVSSGDLLSLHTTPLLIMTNFRSNYSPPLAKLSPAFVLPDILQLAGLDHPFYVRFLDRVRRQVPALTPDVCLDSQMRPMTDIPPAAARAVREYHLIQHDILFGRRYSAKELFAFDQ